MSGAPARDALAEALEVTTGFVEWLGDRQAEALADLDRFPNGAVALSQRTMTRLLESLPTILAALALRAGSGDSEPPKDWGDPHPGLRADCPICTPSPAGSGDSEPQPERESWFIDHLHEGG